MSFPCCDCPSLLHPTLYPQNKASALRLCMMGILPMMLSPLYNTQSGLSQLVCSSLFKPMCTGPFPHLWFCSVSPIWNALHKCFSLAFPQNLAPRGGFEYKSFIWELVPENNGRGVGKYRVALHVGNQGSILQGDLGERAWTCVGLIHRGLKTLALLTW